MNEYIAFRSAHGIDDKSYKDLYLGDYFKIQDGTYNVEWMVAHFDYYYNKGNIAGDNGVLLIPRSSACGETKMNPSERDTTGGYKSSLAYTTVCPAIATALSTVLGSYLKVECGSISKSMNPNHLSMVGAGFYGDSSSNEEVTFQAILPSEPQIFGSSITVSSMADCFSSSIKLAVFNFINPVQYGRIPCWLSSVSTAAHFSMLDTGGEVSFSGANNTYGVRPLIYIG